MRSTAKASELKVTENLLAFKVEIICFSSRSEETPTTNESKFILRNNIFNILFLILE